MSEGVEGEREKISEGKKGEFFPFSFAKKKTRRRGGKGKKGKTKNRKTNYSRSSVVTSSSLRMSIDPTC